MLFIFTTVPLTIYFLTFRNQSKNIIADTLASGVVVKKSAFLLVITSCISKFIKARVLQYDRMLISKIINRHFLFLYLSQHSQYKHSIIMKRRQFPLKSLNRQCVKSNSNYNVHESSSRNRVSILSDDAKASLRAGQIIGTLPRAIEELVQNSIVHGKATIVDVKVGTVNTEKYGRTTLLEVKDNGSGIDAKSTETLIGIEHCTSYTDSISNHNSLKGETLKSLAAMSVEFRITTASKVRQIDGVSQKVRLSHFAPSKSRKRKFSGDFNRDESQSESKLIICEKVIREGSVISFKSMIEGRTDIQFDTNVLHDTGTLIQTYGLFHSFAVRKRHYELNSSSSQATSKDRVVISQVQNCIQILALAFPHVSVRLTNETLSSAADWEWINHSQSKEKSSYSALMMTSNSDIRHRLVQLCGENEVTQCSLININFNEGGYTSSRHTRFAPSSTPSRNEWKMRGILCFKKRGGDIEGKSTEATMNRNRRQEFIFINGKLSKTNSALSDLIQNTASKGGSCK